MEKEEVFLCQGTIRAVGILGKKAGEGGERDGETFRAMQQKQTDS